MNWQAQHPVSQIQTCHSNPMTSNCCLYFLPILFAHRQFFDAPYIVTSVPSSCSGLGPVLISQFSSLSVLESLKASECSSYRKAGVLVLPASEGNDKQWDGFESVLFLTQHIRGNSSSWFLNQYYLALLQKHGCKDILKNTQMGCFASNSLIKLFVLPWAICVDSDCCVCVALCPSVS